MAASTATMKVAVATKMSKRELAKKNSTSGPRSRASLRIGLSWGLGVMSGVCVARRAPFHNSRFEPDQGAGKFVRRERRQIVDALADADEMYRHFKLLGDGDQNAAAGGAVELGHDEAGDADELAENLDLRQRVLADGGVEH